VARAGKRAITLAKRLAVGNERRFGGGKAASRGPDLLHVRRGYVVGVIVVPWGFVGSQLGWFSESAYGPTTAAISNGPLPQ
jgi:hypothetical protein